ncbi:uncharacterized protein [Dermacentor albipictus]|uniref:uncharacterized protein n=1 Tax=Dermacentor albipictus TaxID=60249 RepID=UPI0038FC9317
MSSTATTTTTNSTASTRRDLTRSNGSIVGSSKQRRELSGRVVAVGEEHSMIQGRQGGRDSHYSCYSRNKVSQRKSKPDEGKSEHKENASISKQNANGKPLDRTTARSSQATRQHASDATDRKSARKRRGSSHRGSALTRKRHQGSTATFEPMRELSNTSVNSSGSRLVRKLSRSLPMAFMQNELGTKQKIGVDVAVGTMLLILLLVFAGLLYARFTRQKDATVSSCTKECLNAKRYIERLINVKHSACGDFYERVCSSWSYTDNAGFISDMVKETDRRLNSSLFEESSSTVASEQVKRARTIYRSCYTYATSDVHVDSALRTADKVIKFTSLRKAENWNELLQSLIRFSFEIGIHTVFSVDFVGDKGRPVLHIAAGEPIAFKRIEKASLKKFKDIVRETLRVPINVVMAIDQHVTDAIRSHDSSEKQGSLESFVSGAIPGLSAIDWIIAVNRVVPTFSRIRIIDTVVTNGIDRVRAALNVLTEAGFKNAIEYHVANIAAGVTIFDLFQLGSEASMENVAQLCLHVTKNVMRHSWPHVAADVLSTTNRQKVLRDIFSVVKEALAKNRALYWTSDSVYAKAVKEIDHMSLLIPHDQSLQRRATREVVEASEVSEDDGRISTSIATLVRALKDQRAFSMTYPPSTEDILLWKNEATDSPSYVPSASAIVVPTLYHIPHLLYSEHVPVYFNYGTVGAVLAHETMVAFALAASHTTPDGRREYWWSGINPERYNGTIGCLHQLHADLGFGLTVSNEQTDVMVISSLGLRLAFDSMHMSLKSVTRKDSSDAIWHQAARTFFTRFCLLFCDPGRGPWILSPREMCLLPVHSMKEFGVTFECQSEFYKTSSCQF